jgi:hypothetical protein
MQTTQIPRVISIYRAVFSMPWTTPYAYYQVMVSERDMYMALGNLSQKHESAIWHTVWYSWGLKTFKGH